MKHKTNKKKQAKKQLKIGTGESIKKKLGLHDWSEEERGETSDSSASADRPKPVTRGLTEGSVPLLPNNGQPSGRPCLTQEAHAIGQQQKAKSSREKMVALFSYQIKGRRVRQK